MSDAAVLEAAHLSLRFGGVEAARDVSLGVAEGEMFAIVGQNGAGKTTFLNLCTGQVRPDRGDIRLAGRSIVGLRPRAITRLGLVRTFQRPQLFPERSVIDHLRFASAAGGTMFWHPFRALERLAPERDIEGLLGAFALEGIAERAVRGVPEGQQKLLDVAMALALRPRVLLLDEPTSGVASAEKIGFMARLISVLRARGVSAVFVEHDMEVVAQFADRVAVWVEGAIFRIGRPGAILGDHDVQARIL